MDTTIGYLRVKSKALNTAQKGTLKNYSIYACGVKLWTLHECHVTTIEGKVIVWQSSEVYF